MTCQPLPHSIEALDLSAYPVQSLSSLRFLILNYLEDIETQLAGLESPDVWSKRELTIDDARKWLSEALDMLESIRQDVCAQLPDFPDIKSRIPDHVPSMDEMRAHLPDVRSTLADMRSRLDDVFHEYMPLSYIPTLSMHIQNLHSHLSSIQLPPELAPLSPSILLAELMETLHGFDAAQASPQLALRKGEDLVEKAAKDIANAIKRSFDGVRLISYDDLPHQWRNNPYVIGGYRFIPIERWPLIIMSLFTCHNETLNIHTHLIPCIIWAVSTFILIGPRATDLPEFLFMVFALLCLFTSSLWHTMAGCAHQTSMEFCARVDYVGIGWLISASVGTVVHYGFQCQPTLGRWLIMLCFLTGLAGNIVPFMSWFNDYKYRGWRVVFFLSLIFSAITPLCLLAHLHTAQEVLGFIAPVAPSLVSYAIGLTFYISHAPERWMSEKWKSRLDAIGVGSHCIWHCFIVLAVSQHRQAIGILKGGMGCEHDFA